MSFGVKYKLIERNDGDVIGEEQVKVLECFSEPETLHLVAVMRIVSRLDVTNGRVANIQLGVFLKRLKDLPTPILVGFVSRQTKQVE